MLKTVRATKSDATDLIRRYDAFKRSEVEHILSRGTGEAALAIEVQILSQAADRMAQEARAILARETASELSEDEVHDLTAIAEELELAGSEGSDHSHPDTIWKDLESEKKRIVTERLPVDRSRADHLRARLRGDLRKQVQLPPPDLTPKTDPKVITKKP